MPKRFVLAPDSFKESMTAQEACLAMQMGLSHVFKDAEFVLCPMADGGEGTLDAIEASLNAKRVNCTVTGPLPHQRISTYFIVIENQQMAVIEMAKANGIDLLKKADRNPLHTTTLGTGEIIRAALDLGVKKIMISLGGSVTNDAGAGMATALGARFLDQAGQPIHLGGGFLDQVSSIDISGLDERLKDTDIVIASDVANPLLGQDGASHVFAPQKGANMAMVEKLEHNLSHFAKQIEKTLGHDLAQVKGAGAAGGLAAGLIAFTHASLASGFDLIAQMLSLEDKIKTADMVFTSEGAIDHQTQFGKVPIGIAKIAKRHHKPVIVCAGRVGSNLDDLYAQGISAIFGIIDQIDDPEKLLQTGPYNLNRTCQNIGYLLAAAET